MVLKFLFNVRVIEAMALTVQPMCSLNYVYAL